MLAAIAATPAGVRAWARFAGDFGAELSIVHAIPPSTTRLEGVYFDPAWRADMVAGVRREIGALQDDLHVKAEVVVEVGDVPAAVSAAAESMGADLVVVGRRHAHGVLGRLRTNTYGIVRESPCPVVAV